MEIANKSICIIAHNAYGVLAGIDTGHSGGIEVQTPMMAKWLVKNSYAVSMITWDEGIDGPEIIDGVQSIKLCRRDAGVRVVRFIHPRWTSFNKALSKADADIYYYNCGDLGLGQLVIWAHRHGKQVIYSVASEKDCYRDLSHLPSIRDRVMYQYGLKRADKIIVQTNTQQDLLKSEYGLDSVVIPMPSKGYPAKAVSSQERLSQPTPRVLWVGRINKEKRPDWLLDIAASCPEITFDIIGAENNPSQYGREITERADKLSNVKMHGRVQHEMMGNFYKQATLLCSTSEYEGFPNVYLEAWSTGLPLVSTIDPDSVVERYGMGSIANDQATLIQSIKTLIQPDKHAKASAAALSYFQQNHAIDASMNRFKTEFDNMILGGEKQPLS